MRTSEYYAAGIHGFFVGLALDAIDQDREAVEPATVRPLVARFDPDADYDFDPNECSGCSCAATAYPPCSHCENDHKDGN